MIKRLVYKALDGYMAAKWQEKIERTETRSIRSAKAAQEAEGNANLSLVKAGANSTDIETLIQRVESLEKKINSNAKTPTARRVPSKKAS
jgi:hypothetical protein